MEYPEIKLAAQIEKFHNCYICILPGSSDVLIKQAHVADLLSENSVFVARIRVSKIQVKSFNKSK